MAKVKVISLALSREDLEALKGAVSFELENEIKTGRQHLRVKLYALKRRLTAALLELERR